MERQVGLGSTGGDEKYLVGIGEIDGVGATCGVLRTRWGCVGCWGHNRCGG